MSRIFEATCSAAGIVSIEGFSLTEVDVIGAGQAESEGIALIQGGKVFYIPSATSNLVDTIDQIISSLEAISEALNKVGTTFTTVGAGMTGITTAPPPTLPVDVAAITAKATELTAIVTELETLKGALK